MLAVDKFFRKETMKRKQNENPERFRQNGLHQRLPFKSGPFVQIRWISRILPDWLCSALNSSHSANTGNVLSSHSARSNSSNAYISTVSNSGSVSNSGFETNKNAGFKTSQTENQIPKKNRFQTSFACILAFAVLAGLLPVYAEDYSDEDAWYKKCTQVQTTKEGIKACQGFQEHQNQKRDKLNEDINKLNESIDALNQDASQIEALAQEQRELSDDLQSQISLIEASIAATEASISDTTKAIALKQKEIDMWDAQIKERMRQEQGRTATNSLVDLLMGSSSLADMLRRLTGLQRITSSDQNQIDELNQKKQDLEDSIAGLTSLIEQNEEQAAALEEQKKAAQELEDNYETLVKDYQEKIAEIQAQKRSVELDRDAVKDFTISVDLSKAFYDNIPSSKEMVLPVENARISAGTWAYNGGGLHLGMDFAAPIGSELHAPANGLILYASNTQPTNSGYLGNWSGLPYGSGNYIQMLCEVDGTLYSVSFAHLSNEFNVKAGDIVLQSQVLAKTGNAGNSTGPHTHVEVFNLGNMSMQEAVEAFKKNNDFTFGAGWGVSQKACEAGNPAPCRERPEVFFAK